MNHFCDVNWHKGYILQGLSLFFKIIRRRYVPTQVYLLTILISISLCNFARSLLSGLIHKVIFK